jgi:hypothetical protein
MKVLYIALELGDGNIQDLNELSKLLGLPIKNIKVLTAKQCTGIDRHFLWLVDLYLWTCKYWYGLSQDRLTFIRIKGVDEMSPFFALRYCDQMRFAISAKSITIFDRFSLDTLMIARSFSTRLFNEKRIDAIRPFMKELEANYKILFLRNNPYH